MFLSLVVFTLVKSPMLSSSAPAAKTARELFLELSLLCERRRWALICNRLCSELFRGNLDDVGTDFETDFAAVGRRMTTCCVH
jgi:hypothetical protein